MQDRDDLDKEHAADLARVARAGERSLQVLLAFVTATPPLGRGLVSDARARRACGPTRACSRRAGQARNSGEATARRWRAVERRLVRTARSLAPINAGDEAAGLRVAQMRILHFRGLENALQDSLERRRADPPLDDEHSIGAVALEGQRKGAERRR